jgi:hypothetical protein
MATLIAKTLPKYGSKILKPGDRFEVEDERHIQTLILSHKAELAKDDEKRTYKRRDMKAEQ